jgi:hypothetical protein
MQGVQALPVRHAAAMLVVATLAPHVLAWIGLPLALILAPGSAWVAVFLTFLFSPLFALPIALCLGLPALVALSRFSRLGLGHCVVAGSACGVLGMFVVGVALRSWRFDGTLSSVLSNGDVAWFAGMGAVIGGLFRALHRYAQSRAVFEVDRSSRRHGRAAH